MKATLYVFAYAGLNGRTHLCVSEEARTWPELVHGIAQDDALIDRARSNAATHFWLDRDAGDVMLMVDHDMQWEKGDLRYIAEKAAETHGIVAGLYPKRGFSAGHTFHMAEPCRFLVGEDRLIPATFVPTGFIDIHRDVVNEIVKQVTLVIQNFYPVFTPLVVETDRRWEHLSEDWAFCYRAKGLPIHIAAKPKLRHGGSYDFRMIDSLTEPPSDKDLRVEITHNSARVLQVVA